MPKSPKRDNAYYQRQLEGRFPTIYSDLLAGKYRSLREALIEAGIKKPRSPLNELKNGWRKASPTERREFLNWLRAQTGMVITGSSATSPGTSKRVVAVDGRLESWARRRIEDIISHRRMKLGDVMSELGFKELNASLGRSLARGSKLQPEMVSALEDWLEKNKAV